MMKTNFTFRSKLFKPIMAAWLFTLFGIGTANAQCSLGCTGQIQVSLDNDNCQATITPSDLLTDSTTCPGGVFIVELRHNGVLIPNNPTITHEFVGKTLEAKVIDSRPAPTGGNSCWGYVKVEDKLAPEIVCDSPADILCYEEINYSPTVEENCGSYTLYTLDSIELVNDCSDTSVDADVLRTVTKMYKAVDGSGNESKVCTITYDVLRIPSLDSIKAPKSFLYPNSNYLCNQVFDKLPNGAPTPEEAGYPTLNGMPLKPGVDTRCNIIVDFKDVVLKDVQCVTKIMRTWTILEWSCDTRPAVNRVQMIEIADTNKPIITGAKDITVSTTPHHCDALVTVPPVTVFDSCTMASDITVKISGGTPLIVGNGGKTSLPVGMSTLIYTATDKCGNTTTAAINVTVEDLTPPVAVCDQNTTVSVTTDGLAWVPAKVFDDGSYDECALAKMLVRRMGDDICDCEAPQFDDFISLGEYNGHWYVLSRHKIESRLAHKHGVAIGGYLNITETKAERDWINTAVKSVNDTLGYLSQSTQGGKPFFIDRANGGSFKTDLGPNDLYHYVIELTEKCGWSSYAKFCCADVGNDVMVSFRVVDKNCNYNDCMVNAEVQDKLPPAITCPPDMTIDCDEYYNTGDLVADFGPYTVYDNCEDPAINDRITFENVNQCNVGNLVRTITATDKGQRSASCEQKIQLDPQIYDYEDVEWPGDVTLNECFDPDNPDMADMISPDVLGVPTFPGDNQCSLLGSDYEDWVYRFNNSNGEACLKIVRRWTVIDWCNRPNGQFYTLTPHDQIIKVNDLVKPTIESSCERKSTCTYDPTCTDGFIELTAEGDDNCTDVLSWTYQIDVNNDGTFETGSYKGQKLTNSGKGNTIVASGSYPIGTHKIKYTFADRCGNVVSCEQLFDIVNCKAPTPYCLNGLAVDLMPVDSAGQIIGGMVELWANDFDAGSFHTCKDYKVYVSFSKNILDTGRVFTCADKGRKDVMIYASVITAMGDTLSSFCNTFVDIQDNMGACGDDDILRYGISGRVATPQDVVLKNAEVVLQSNESVIKLSDDNGMYAFSDMPTGGDYMLYPTKNDDHMNGISTLDLVLIQRHVLGIQNITSPYLQIAADVTKDGKINVSDLVELRKLILGVTDKFSNNNSWRFIDKSIVFPAGVNPLDVVESDEYEIYDFNSDMKVDFSSIKIGDISGDVTVNLRDKAVDNRNALTLQLQAEDKSFGEGEIVTFSANHVNGVVSGMQFTVEYDVDKLSFVGIDSRDNEISEANFGFQALHEGKITFSGFGIEAKNISELFDLKFEAKESGKLSNSIAITSAITKAEAYNAGLDAMDISLRFNGVEDKLVLYQNIPNPFANTTMIAFNMPKAGNAQINVLDVTGKMIYSTEKYYERGLNEITLNKSDINLSGVMYYQLTVNNESLIKKMVIIE